MGTIVSVSLGNHGASDAYPTLLEKFPYSELFWSTFSRIRTEYGEILCISPYLVRMRENTDQNNSEYGHFLRSANEKNFNNYNANINGNVYKKLSPEQQSENINLDGISKNTKKADLIFENIFLQFPMFPWKFNLPQL